jgi:hypothetical protein
MLFRMADRDELLKKAGGFFSKLGGQIKETATTVGSQIGPIAAQVGGAVKEGATVAGAQIAQTAKQVTGLGRGSVKLELDQTKAGPGGTIQGRVVLALTEPVEAKRLIVQLRARQKQVNVRRDSGGRTIGTSHADVYEFTLELGGAKTFESETLAFELTVPTDALDLKASPPSTPLGDVVRTVAAAVSPTAGPIEWQVVTALEIPWGRNLSHEVDIVVTQ